MNLVTALFQITKHSLGIWELKEARKYLDEVLKLEQAYYDEQKKPEDKRNHALMDNAINRLCLISKASTTFGKKGA